MDSFCAVMVWGLRCFVCLLFVAAGAASAGDLKYIESMDGAINPVQRYGSHLDGCNAVRAKVDPTWVPTACAPGNNTCTAAVISAGGECIQYWNIPHKFGVRQAQTKALYCPDSKPTWNGTACVIEDPCKKDAGKVIGRESIWMFLETAPTGNAVCVDGCTHQAKSVVCAPRFGSPGAPGDVLQVSQGEECEAQGPFKNSGYQCSSGVPGAGSPYAVPPKAYYDNGKGIADCAASGGAWGEINGVSKCVKGLTNGTSGKGTGAGVNGTSSTSKSDTKTNADGSTTTTKTTDTTTCKDGVCTTVTETVTETTSTSGTKTSDTKTESAAKEQSDFCKANPEHQLCIKNDMTGDCSAGFSCTGDPVQCATAKAAQEMKCALSSKTDGTTLADQMVAGTDPALQGENNPLIPKTVTLSSITPTRTLSGSCPPPITVSLFGQTASFSFDQICPWIETLGRILVGLAWLTAFFIVSRSIK